MKELFEKLGFRNKRVRNLIVFDTLVNTRYNRLESVP